MSHRFAECFASASDCIQIEVSNLRRGPLTSTVGPGAQFERLGKFLGGNNAKVFNHEMWLKMYARDLEQHFDELRIASQAEGKPVGTYVFCGDLEGFEGIVWSMASVISLLKFLTKEVEENYPEVNLRALAGR
eukprot:4495080-Pyramimonas_sp.AAC.1